MLKRLARTAILLLAMIGMTRLRLDPRAIDRFPALFFLAAITLVVVNYIWLGHIELAIAVAVPSLVALAAGAGAAGWCGLRIARADEIALVATVFPATFSSERLMRRSLLAFRGQNDRVASARLRTLILFLAFGIVLLGLTQFRSGRLHVIGSAGFLALGFGVVAGRLILPPVIAFLLPTSGSRIPPGLGWPGRNDSKGQTRVLYRYLDIAAEQYVTWKLRLDPIFAQINSAVPKVGRILDAGCGFGIMSNLLAKRSSQRDVTGVEFDEKKLRIARCASRTLPNAHYIQGDLLDVEYSPADCVLLVDVLHYWSAEKQSEVIARCAAALQAGGMLLFREGMQAGSSGHRVVHWAERAAQLLGHNPRGDGLHFQTREFYLQEFTRHRLELVREPKGWGRGSNAVMIFRRL
jgi:SAM-dependent methyltransferase